jgi:hypothetical protein
VRITHSENSPMSNAAAKNASTDMTTLAQMLPDPYTVKGFNDAVTRYDTISATTIMVARHPILA